MASRTVFSEEDKLFYITITCFDWLPLFQLTDGYHIVYDWFSHIKKKYGIEVCCYVIMPNHLHCIFSFPQCGVTLNQIIKAGKLHMARELLKLLKAKGEDEVLALLKESVPVGKQLSGQGYCVFKRSFDAKAIVSNASTGIA